MAETKEVRNSTEGADLVLQAKESIQNVKERADNLLQVLSGEGDITVDCSNVSYLDTASVQVLIGFVNAMSKKGRSVYFDGMETEQFMDIVGSLGLQDCFSATDSTDDDDLCPVF